MILKFKTIKLHNFLSFGDSVINLDDRKYCKVSGINKNKRDNALSNGSGKSSIWSAICWALTGETIQGISSNIVNINGEDGCFVELEFSVNNDDYKLIRYREYDKVGNHLKIYINGEDKSGKGIRESQKLLEQYLPDLTSDLIGSVIILGQGLPHKFSNNTPSGRKELLEKLSQTDFMINDVRERVNKRKSVLDTEMRVLEDTGLKYSTEINLYTSTIESLSNDLKTLESSVLSDEEYNEKMSANQHTLEHYTKLFESGSENYNLCNEKILALTDNKKSFDIKELEEINKSKEEFDKVINDTINEMNILRIEINGIKSEITKLESITDICPTCGQKLPDVHKPDTTQLKINLEEKLSKLKPLEDYLSSLNTKKTSSINEIKSIYSNLKSAIVEEINSLQNELRKHSNDMSNGKNGMNDTNNIIKNLQLARATFTSKRDTLINSINENKDKLEKVIALNESNKISKENLDTHINAINKILSLVKRDFRTYLLSEVIKYIDSKSKEYSQDIFNTTELDFVLDGNDINISYCGKAFENLSGGEKQRIDLIIQFAIRDMMSCYLDFKSNILVLDEIFDNLDIIGTNQVLNLISNKLSDVESIFIISHHDDLEIPYDSELTVVKDERGISSVL